MKTLFITHPYPNYIPDLLLHGLRKLFGSDVVDYPKKECLYQGVLGLGVCPADQRCPGWFPNDNGKIDREDIWHKASTDYFKYIVCDCRAIPWMLKQLPNWSSRLVVIDGEDLPVRIPPGNYIICRRETDGSDFSIPLPMALPEELLRWITAYDNEPKKFSIGFLGSTCDDRRKKIVDAIARIYPDTLFQTTRVPSATNPYPEGRFSRAEYYQNLQKCRIVLSLAGAGNDTFRFWENAACNAVHLAHRFALYIPNAFIDGSHILRFSNLDELRRKIDPILEDEKSANAIITRGRSHLIKFHLTQNRAEYFLNKIQQAY